MSQVARGRVATSLVFLLFGTTLGTWTARIPAIKHGLDLSDGWLSFALLAFAAGAIIGMQSIGRVVDRFGSRRVMLPAAVVEGLVLIPPALMPNLVTLCLALFVFGAVHGSLNIAMNANAIEVQRAIGRPIISSFHAVYSIGGFLGASIGGLFAQAGLSCIAPQVFSAAGNRDPAYAGRALARVASIGYAGFLTGPVVIGAASTLFSLPVALAIPVLLCGFVALTASALKV